MEFPILTERFHESLGYASRLHANQMRKGSKIPYITHLLSVAALVGECGGTETEMIAALLHDAVEDQGGADTLSTIEAKYGREVASLVRDCSDTDQTPKPPWKERKLAYIEHLMRTENPSVLLVSAADKLHNFRSIHADFLEIGERVWDRFSAKKEDTLWYYRELLNIYEKRSAPKRLTLELKERLSLFA